MNEIEAVIQSRQSCRNFDPNRPIPREITLRCLEAARLAPSACNSQPWRYILVDEPERVRQVAECARDAGMNRFAVDAAAFAVVLEGNQNLTAKVGESLKNQNFSGIDMGLSVSQFLLTATAEGVGSCVLGWFQERKLKTLLGIPKMRRVRLLIALGYPAPGDPLRPKIRKTPEEIYRYNRY